MASAAASGGEPKISPATRSAASCSSAVLTDQLLATLDSVLEPLRERQAAEVAEVDQRIAEYGERGSGRKELEERHKRELRRVRTDELRFGLAALASVYRDSLVSSPAPPAGPAGAVRALRALDAAGEALIRNPNETLLVQGLLAALTDAAEA